MEGKKFNWWLVVVPVILLLAALIICLGNFVQKQIAPKAVLTSALSKAFAQLEDRFQGDPLLILADTYDPEGKYTADVELAAENEILGTVVYDMTVQTNSSAHQISAAGAAKTSGQTLDLSLYMDADFMAVASDGLVDGNYYGITYDTFASDLRKVPLLNFLINDNLLDKWDDSVQSIQAQISRSYTQPMKADISKEEMYKVLLGIAALPCEVGETSVVLNETAITCKKLDYQISGEQIGSLLSQLTSGTYSGDATVIVSFYLHEDTVVRIALSGAAGASVFQYSLDLGMNPSENPLTLQGSNGRSDFAITVTTQNSGDRYAEAWDIRKTAGGAAQNHSFAFDWNPQSGALELRTGTLREALSLNLSETEQGFRLATDDILQLIKAVDPESQITRKATPMACTMTVEKGSQITVPGYKNLDQWSMEDFLTLLGGIGSLIGIKID